jgi:hypothetical protein
MVLIPHDVRLDRVRTITHNLGYGVGDEMDSLLAKNRPGITTIARLWRELSHSRFRLAL